MDRKSLKVLSDRLIEIAENLGAGEDAKDIAQQALEVLIKRERPPEHTEAFACRVVRNLVISLHRRQHRRGERTPPSAEELERLAAPQSSMPARLAEDREGWLQLAAATEQFAMFDGQWPRGRTQAVVCSLDEADPKTTHDRLRFYARVVDELPRGARQKRRARKDLFDGIAKALQRAGVLIQDPLPEVDTDDDWDALYKSEEGRGEQRLSHRVLRGSALALRLCPDLTVDEAVDAAARAETAIYADDEPPQTMVLVHEAAPDDTEDAFDVADLTAKLQSLLARRDPHACLILGDENIDFIFLHKKGKRLCAEAIPNRVLRQVDRCMSAAQVARLRQLGWRDPRPGSDDGHTRSWSKASAAGLSAVATELDQVMEQVYGFGPDDEYRMELSFDD